MRPLIVKFGIAILLVCLASLIQNTDLLNIGGIKPNLTLVILVVLSFFIQDILGFLVLVLLGGLLLKVELALTREIVVFITILVALWYSKKWLPWRTFFSNIILVLSATILFYLFTTPVFIYASFNYLTGELLYNLILGIILYLGLLLIYKSSAR